MRYLIAARIACSAFALALLASTVHAAPTDEAGAQHAAIGAKDKPADQACPHNDNPGAQWFPKAGLGLFLHWGLSSVLTEHNPRVGDISWPMIVGKWGHAAITDPQEQARILRDHDWNFDGRPPAITPNHYWAAAQDFHPQKYDPDRWLKAAQKAGFTYAVLTCRHHEGFALWPSQYGHFSTKNYLGGRDLVKPFVAACRKYGLKVGLYYSVPDWYFDRDYFNFMFYGTARNNPWLPELDANLQPRTTTHTGGKREASGGL